MTRTPPPSREGLAGFDEPESVLILSTAHAQHRVILFVRPRDPSREV